MPKTSFQNGRRVCYVWPAGLVQVCGLVIEDLVPDLLWEQAAALLSAPKPRPRRDPRRRAWAAQGAVAANLEPLLTSRVQDLTWSMPISRSPEMSWSVTERWSRSWISETQVAARGRSVSRPACGAPSTVPDCSFNVGGNSCQAFPKPTTTGASPRTAPSRRTRA